MNAASTIEENKTYSLILGNWEASDILRLFFRSCNKDLTPIRDLFICFFSIVASWTIGFIFQSWWVYCITFLAVTSSLIGYVSLVHEAFHDNLSLKTINDFIGRWIIAPALLMDYDSEREIHLSHHKYVGTKDDPTLEAYSISVKQLWKELILRILFIGSFIWIIRKRLSPKVKIKNQSTVFKFAKTLYMLTVQTSIFCLFLIFVPWSYLWNWVLPLVASSVLSSVREFGEHKSFDNVHDVCLVTTRARYLERLFISGCNFNEHAAHHLFPSIPYNRLPELTDLLDKYGWPQTRLPVFKRFTYLKNLFQFN